MFNLPKYKYFYAILDFILIFLTFILSIDILNLGTSNVISYVELFLYGLLISVIFLFFFQYNNLYKINVILSFVEQLSYLLKSFFYGIIVFVFIAFLLKATFFLDSRKLVLIFLTVGISTLVFSRIILLRKLIKVIFNVNQFKRKAIVVGAGKLASYLAIEIEIEKNLGLTIIGFLDDSKTIGTEIINDKKILGKIQDINKILQENEVDEIIVAIDNITYDRLIEILDDLSKTGLQVKVVSELFGIIPEKIITERYSNFSVINLSPQLNQNINYFLKRIIDYVGATLGLILLSPLFIVVSILIKLTSKGPVFYKQTRIGQHGKPFQFIKFRSMTVLEKDDDEERKKMMIDFMKNNKLQKSNSTKIINEKRVTKIGKFIRKTSIDELPQLINVLRGEMSLVGPRPCLPYEYENYEEWQKKRLEVLPGCTGIWQVYGRTDVTFKDSVVLDLYYIKNMSPWLDLQLIFKTFPVMLFAKSGE